MTPPICPHCGATAVLADSAVIYHGVSFGNVWLCANYPRCDARVGAHKADNRPKGTLADAATRAARQEAHAAFDPLWQPGGRYKSRSGAYAALARLLGIPVERCHIALFGVDECRRVVEVCKK